MRARKEKTEFGSVKAVVPKKKKAVYGDVVLPLKIDNSAEKPPTEVATGIPTDSEPTGEEQEMPMTPEDYEQGGGEPEDSGESESTGEPKPMEASESEEEYTPDEALEKLQKLVESMEEYQKQKAEEEAKKKEEEDF